MFFFIPKNPNKTQKIPWVHGCTVRDTPNCPLTVELASRKLPKLAYAEKNGVVIPAVLLPIPSMYGIFLPYKSTKNVGKYL